MPFSLVSLAAISGDSWGASGVSSSEGALNRKPTPSPVSFGSCVGHPEGISGVDRMECSLEHWLRVRTEVY